MTTLQPPRKLDRYVSTVVSDKRTTMLVSRVTDKPLIKRRRWQAMALVAVAAAAAVFFVSRRVDHRVGSNAVSHPPSATTTSDGNNMMTLADGTRIRLRDDGRVRLDRFEPRDVEVTLERGTAELDVVHMLDRPFVVHVGAFDVVDVGTRFVVSMNGGSILVRVDEGQVELRDTTGVLPVRTLAQGESWSTARTEEAAALSAVPQQNVTPKPRAPTAKELIEAADTARVAGHPREAAALLDDVRLHHRSDARAGVAAFQLGRLRLDTLGDAREAVEAFDDAIALAPAASFREDAEARRVEALERAKDPRCREARDTYLARYPSGIHVKEVSARCVVP